MIINDNLKVASISVANLATGGSIGTAITTVDIAGTFLVNQTTASQTLTLPTPTDALAGDRVIVVNTGTASFVVAGITITAGTSSYFTWTGTAWVGDANVGRNAGATVVVAAIAVGNNTVTHNLAMPSGSFSSVSVTALNTTGNQVVFRRVTGSDTTNAIVVNSSVALTNITFYITPLA